jgi:predicted double-glycine peptidase
VSFVFAYIFFAISVIETRTCAKRHYKQNRSCKSTLTAPQKMMTPLTSSKVIRHANAQVIAQQWELSCGGAVWAAL